MKSKAFVCDCCGYQIPGEPFAYGVKATAFIGRQRFDLEYAEACERCSMTLGLAALQAVQKAQSDEMAYEVTH